MLPRRLCLLSLLALPVLAAPARAQSVDELLERIEAQKDGVDPQIWKQLTSFGNEESLEAVQRAIRALQTADQIRYACEAFENYRGVPELEGEAIEYLFEEAQGGKADNRRGAAAGLVKFGDAAEEEQRELLTESKDEVVRAIALGPLMPKLAQEGSTESLETIVDNAWFSTTGSRDQIVGNLKTFQGEEHYKIFFERLKDKKYPDLMKVAIVDVLKERDHPGVTPALVTALKSRSPALQYAVLRVLDERGETGHVRLLQKLARSKDDAVRRLAVVSLSRIMGTDAAWWRDLVSMAHDDDPATRQGAVIALVELRTPQALELLYTRMLSDPDRAVRAEALQQVGNLRRKESVPYLIGRINAETGRTKMDLLTVLRLVTGEDHGSAYERWKRWWEAEGASFELPPYDKALKAERERVKKAKEGRTVTSFYGLEVVSDRVCFILDVSGSMKGETPGGDTRVEVAKTELSQVVEQYPEGDLFNLIFFSTDVYPWQDELVLMNEKMKKAALSYVARQTADGFTAAYDALKLAFEDPRVDTIVFLTDGVPYKGTIDDPSEIRAEVNRWNSTRHIRIHCVSVGGDNRLLIDLAKDSGGDYRAVR